MSLLKCSSWYALFEPKFMETIKLYVFSHIYHTLHHLNIDVFSFSINTIIPCISYYTASAILLNTNRSDYLNFCKRLALSFDLSKVYRNCFDSPLQSYTVCQQTVNNIATIYTAANEERHK